MRSARDMFAECIRREVRGLLRPDWKDCDDAYRQQWLERADHQIRLLRQAGAEIVVNSEVDTHPSLDQTEIAPGISLRSDGGPKFTLTNDGKEIVAFTLPDVILLADRVLRRDPTVRNEPGLLTKLAAATEVYRLSMA